MLSHFFFLKKKGKKKKLCSSSPVSLSTSYQLEFNKLGAGPEMGSVCLEQKAECLFFFLFSQEK